MFKDIALGFRSYRQAFRFIKEHKLWIYFVLPMLVFFLIYYTGFSIESSRNSLSAGEDDGFFMRIWKLILSGILGVLGYVIFNFMRYILIILISPILSIVSERVEKILTGNTYKFNFKQLISDVKRAINISIRNMIWELGITFLIMVGVGIINFIIPFDLSFVTAILMTLVAFYYYGFGFIDFLSERRRLTIQESVIFVRKHRGFTVVLGLVFTLCFNYSNEYLSELRNHETLSETVFLLCVIASSILMSTIPIITIIAATIGVHELVDLSTNVHAKRTNTLEGDTNEKITS